MDGKEQTNKEWLKSWVRKENKGYLKNIPRYNTPLDLDKQMNGFGELTL